MSSTTHLRLPSLLPIPSPLSRCASLQSHNLPRLLYSSPSRLLLSLQSDRRRAARRASPITMSSDHLTSQLELSELSHESDFEKLLSPDGLISICGFGSLLSGRGIGSMLARFFFPPPEYRCPCVIDVVLLLFEQREAHGVRFPT